MYVRAFVWLLPRQPVSSRMVRESEEKALGESINHVASLTFFIKCLMENVITKMMASIFSAKGINIEIKRLMP